MHKSSASDIPDVVTERRNDHKQSQQWLNVRAWFKNYWGENEHCGVCICEKKADDKNIYA